MSETGSTQRRGGRGEREGERGGAHREEEEEEKERERERERGVVTLESTIEKRTFSGQDWALQARTSMM